MVSSHSQAPPRQRPRAEHGGALASIGAHVACSHAAPDHPGAHTHAPVSASQLPWLLHPEAQRTAFSHASPAKYGSHRQLPCTHVPWPWQLDGHALSAQPGPVQPAAHTHTRRSPSQWARSAWQPWRGPPPARIAVVVSSGASASEEL